MAPGRDSTDDFAVELVTGALPVPLEHAAVELRGPAANDLRMRLSGATVRRCRAGRRAGRADTFRLVPPAHLAEGLQHETLRWATPATGDASVLIQEAGTGRFAGRGNLERSQPSAARMSPAMAWEVMAMATQQHYLVAIDDKLGALGRGIEKVLARLGDEQRGTLTQIHRTLEHTRAQLDRGERPSSRRAEELRQGVVDADRICHQLREQLAGETTSYRAGGETPDAVEATWERLLAATRILLEASQLQMRLPPAPGDDMRTLLSEERERVGDAVAELQRLARDLATVHLRYHNDRLAADVYGPAKRRERVALAVRERVPDIIGRRLPPRKADGQSRRELNRVAARSIARVAVPVAPPGALLVRLHDDGRVTVAADPGEPAQPGCGSRGIPRDQDPGRLDQPARPL